MVEIHGIGARQQIVGDFYLGLGEVAIAAYQNGELVSIAYENDSSCEWISEDNIEDESDSYDDDACGYFPNAIYVYFRTGGKWLWGIVKGTDGLPNDIPEIEVANTILRRWYKSDDEYHKYIHRHDETLECYQREGNHNVICWTPSSWLISAGSKPNRSVFTARSSLE